MRNGEGGRRLKVEASRAEEWGVWWDLEQGQQEIRREDVSVNKVVGSIRGRT